jgi:hypothetical protein
MNRHQRRTAQAKGRNAITELAVTFPEISEAEYRDLVHAKAPGASEF